MDASVMNLKYAYADKNQPIYHKKYVKTTI